VNARNVPTVGFVVVGLTRPPVRARRYAVFRGPVVEEVGPGDRVERTRVANVKELDHVAGVELACQVRAGHREGVQRKAGRVTFPAGPAGTARAMLIPPPNKPSAP
jgi:hypothetical protein